jgi:GTP-binding protein
MKRLPRVAIVGRPNVGKSTLFNRITGKRRALVHATPGVTRDIQRGEADWNGVHFELIDTGGLLSGIDDSLIGEVERRALREAEESDAIIFVGDGQSGLISDDTDIARRVRELGVPVLMAVNKTEKRDSEAQSGDFYRLGFETVYPVSALHGQGTGDLLDDLVRLLPRYGESEAGEDLRLAMAGVPNVGKSSLVNALVGEEANIVDSRPGTTRDSIDVTFRWHGRRVTLVDTAGIKRRSRTEKGVDTLSAIKSLESIERCDVVIFMLDASRIITAQDVKVGSYAHRAGKGVVVCFNKWDLVEKADKTYREFESEFRRRFSYLSYAPILFISALTHQRLARVVETAWRVKEQRERRIPTSEFNRFIEELVSRNPPPFYGGGNGKIYYGTQVETSPPRFSLFVNKQKYFGKNYVRFVGNRIREAFEFDGTLIRVSLVEKKGATPPR